MSIWNRKLIKPILIGLFVIALFGVSSFYVIHVRAATGWLSGYSYRVKIPIAATAAGAQTNYQVSLMVHSKSGTNTGGDIYTNGHLQDSTTFNDIRFTSSDGTTLKSYYISTISAESGGNKATVYVKLDSPAAGTTDYYLYYGKAGDTNASNYDNAFTKDFDDTNIAGLWHMDEQVPGVEKTTNGSFENWTGSALDNWTFDQTSAGVRDITKESSIIHGGSYAVKLNATNAGGTGFGIYQDITTTNGAEYQLTIYQRLSSRTAGVLKIEAWDNTNSVSLSSQSVNTTASSYSLLTVRFTSTNTTSVRIKIYLNSETTSGTAYVDDVSVRQSSSSLTDASGNSNTATIYGAARMDTDGGMWGSVNKQFSTGSALNFDGINDYADAGNAASLQISGVFTVEAWVYPNVSGNGGIVTKQTGSGATGATGFYLTQSSATVYLYIYQGDQTRKISNGKSLTLGQWNFVSAYYDGNNISVCVNASCSTPVAVTGFSPANGQNLTVGRYSYTPAIYFNGYIDDVRMYSRVLSTAEMSKQYVRSKYASADPAWSTPGTEEQYIFSVTTNTATASTDTSITFNGYVNGLGGDSSVNVYFNYGTNPSNLNQTTATQSLSAIGSFSTNVTGLVPGTTYYYQAVEQGSSTVTGSVVSCSTAFFISDYYYAFLNTNGTLSFENKSDLSTLVSSASAYSFNYGVNTNTNISPTNPSFETATGGTPDGWTLDKAYMAQSSEQASQGTYSLKWTMSSTDTVHRHSYSSLMQINSGSYYTLSLDTYMSSYTSGDNPIVEFVYYTTTDGTGTAYYSPLLMTIPVTTGSWITSTATWQVPFGSNAKSFKVMLYSDKATMATMYWDNIVVTQHTTTYQTNGNVSSTIGTAGDIITVTSTDDTNTSATLAHKYTLNKHSPYVTYSPTITYKQNVNTTEERFDFLIPSQSATIMTRDLVLNTFDTTKQYYSDLYTPKVMKFANGVSFLGNDTMQSMVANTSGTNTMVSFYSDYSYNHPHGYYTKNGQSLSTVEQNTMKKSSGDSYSISITWYMNPSNTSPKSLVKTRQPYGYDATLLFTNHPDTESLAAINAIGYGTEDSTSAVYGTKGIVGYGLGWTKGIFVSGQTGADLNNAAYKALTDKMSNDGVEIIGHSITPNTDSRSVVDTGLTTLNQYSARDWIDHGASGGTENWEDLASQGTLVGDTNYILDLLANHNYNYAWSYNDLTNTTAYALNMLDVGNTSSYTPFFYYNSTLDNNPGHDNKLYLWSTFNTNKVPDLYYTNANVDTLISQRGVHLGHEYMGYSSTQNHAWYVNGTTGKTEIYPTFDNELSYMATKQQAGQLYSPTMAVYGDYLVGLKDVLITNNSDGTYTVTNNGSSSITGVTLLAENSLQSVTIDGKTLTTFGGSLTGHSQQIILPTLTAGQSVTLSLTYGTKDTTTTPSVVSNDTGKNKVNNLSGYWDATSQQFTITAEGKHQSYSFTITIPSFANKTVYLYDGYQDQNIGAYSSDANGAITFSATLGSTHTFVASLTPHVLSSGPTNTPVPGAPTCNNKSPQGQSPWLYAAIPQNGNSISLYFTDASAPYDHYTIAHGTSSNNYVFGLDNAGGVGTRKIIINYLLPNTTYYFRVRAGNGCAPGSWSNEIFSTTKGLIETNALTFVSSTITSSNTIQNTIKDNNVCVTYTVKSGDSLWSIAQNELGNGDKFEEIKKLNKDTYPTLTSSNSLVSGWKLNINCPSAEKLNTNQDQSGYELNIVIKDQNNHPLSGAKVTLHSQVKTAISDKNGIVHFTHVEKGNHRVILSANNYTGEQSINMSGDMRTYDLAITVKPTVVTFSPLVILIILVLFIIIIVFFIIIMYQHRRIVAISLKQDTNQHRPTRLFKKISGSSHVR